jgi:hypothetical protein
MALRLQTEEVSILNTIQMFELPYHSIGWLKTSILKVLRHCFFWKSSFDFNGLTKFLMELGVSKALKIGELLPLICN